jgi:hypothetical protein
LSQASKVPPPRRTQAQLRRAEASASFRKFRRFPQVSEVSAGAAAAGGGGGVDRAHAARRGGAAGEAAEGEGEGMRSAKREPRGNPRTFRKLLQVSEASETCRKLPEICAGFRLRAFPRGTPLSRGMRPLLSASWHWWRPPAGGSFRNLRKLPMRSPSRAAWWHWWRPPALLCAATERVEEEGAAGARARTHAAMDGGYPPGLAARAMVQWSSARCRSSTGRDLSAMQLMRRRAALRSLRAEGDAGSAPGTKERNGTKARTQGG